MKSKKQYEVDDNNGEVHYVPQQENPDFDIIPLWRAKETIYGTSPNKPLPLGYTIDNFQKIKEIQMSSIEDRYRGFFLCGGTGFGKTVWLGNAFLSDVYAGRAVTLMDFAKGDLVDYVLARYPENRYNDLLLIRPASKHSKVIGLDPFEELEVPLDEIQKNRQYEIKKDIVTSLYRDPNESWGVRFPYLLDTLTTAICEVGGGILDLIKVFESREERELLSERVTDAYTKEAIQQIRGFSDHDFQPLVARSLQIKTDKTLRSMLSTGSAISLYSAINSGKVVIFDFRKGVLGESVSRILGIAAFNKLWMAIQARASIPPRKRPPLFNYIDEFQNCFTSPQRLRETLTETRSYKAGFTFACQYPTMLEKEVQDAIFSNCTIMAFNVQHSNEARLLTDRFPPYSIRDLLDLPKYQAVCRIMEEDMLSKSFIIRGYPELPVEANEEEIEALERLSVESYGILPQTRAPRTLRPEPARDVEEKLAEKKFTDRIQEAIALLRENKVLHYSDLDLTKDERALLLKTGYAGYKRTSSLDGGSSVYYFYKFASIPVKHDASALEVKRWSQTRGAKVEILGDTQMPDLIINNSIGVEIETGTNVHNIERKIFWFQNQLRTGNIRHLYILVDASKKVLYMKKIGDVKGVKVVDRAGLVKELSRLIPSK